MRRKKLGEVLQERGHLSKKDLEAAMQEQQKTIARLGEILLERQIVSKDALVGALEEVMSVPYVDCRQVTAQEEALRLVPKDVANRYCLLPLFIEGRKLTAIMAEPQNVRALDELRFLTGKDITPSLGFRSEILAAITKHYGESPARTNTAGLAEELRDLEEEGEVAASAPASITPDLSEFSDASDIVFVPTSSRHMHKEAMEELQSELKGKRTPAVRIVSRLVMDAYAKRASDIHMEPQASGLVVRIRVDGVLRELARVPAAAQNQVISRVKILADMDIAERRNPQDGRFLVRIGEEKSLDFRVSTLPTHHGEKIVMRLLDPSSPQAPFDQLGLSSEQEAALKQILALPQGVLLVTGPTGSGKSTTLYTGLAYLHEPGINIVTVEDPIEYMIPGINQVQVNVKAGLTFASCLRSMLRQDPNVIMVGEIRDRETAEIAMKASQTGHLVLSTLHTNDSISSVNRLLDLGIPPYLIASSLSAIMAQRLVRRLCSCHRTASITPEHAAKLEAAGMAGRFVQARVPVGCRECEGTGYRGRVGIYELLVIGQEIRDALRSEGRIQEVRALARGAGFRTMQEDALDKVKAGLTSLDEVLRVVPFESTAHQRCRACGRELAPAFRFCPYCATPKEAAPPGGGRNAPGVKQTSVKEMR